MATTDKLSALDTSFLWFERPDAPVHVGAVATFEAGPLLDAAGNLRIDEIRERVDARLGALPRLRRRLAPVPFDLDRPRWVDHPDFDIADHVKEVRAPAPGDDAALRRVAAELQSQVLPRDRPLWDIHFVTGLDGDRVGLVERVHHSLVDGVSGVDLAAVLLDVTPDAPEVPQQPWRPATAPSDGNLAVEVLRDRLTVPVRAARTVADAALHPLRPLRAAATLGRGLATAVGHGLFAPRISLNRPIGGPRRLAWVRADLAAVRATGRRAGGTINDVVLAAVAGGLRALLAERGEPLPADLALKVLVPVSLRADHEHGALGNRVTAMFAPLPVGIGDPGDRLAAVVATMGELKAEPEGEAFAMLLGAADAVPAGAARLLTRAIERQPFVNLVVTNVPGPPVPLYAAGARMLEAFPVVPLGANLTVGVAVLSYDRALTVTLTADEEACPDLDVLAAGIERALAGYAA